jgi:hypothetical protein
MGTQAFLLLPDTVTSLCGVFRFCTWHGRSRGLAILLVRGYIELLRSHGTRAACSIRSRLRATCPGRIDSDVVFENTQALISTARNLTSQYIRA